MEPNGAVYMDGNSALSGGNLNLIIDAIVSGQNWIIINGFASSSGGGIYTDSSVLLLRNATITNNVANIEGKIFNLKKKILLT
jgi:hypothetical protein